MYAEVVSLLASLRFGSKCGVNLFLTNHSVRDSCFVGFQFEKRRTLSCRTCTAVATRRCFLVDAAVCLSCCWRGWSCWCHSFIFKPCANFDERGKGRLCRNNMHGNEVVCQIKNGCVGEECDGSCWSCSRRRCCQRRNGDVVVVVGLDLKKGLKCHHGVLIVFRRCHHVCRIMSSSICSVIQNLTVQIEMLSVEV